MYFTLTLHVGLKTRVSIWAINGCHYNRRRHEVRKSIYKGWKQRRVVLKMKKENIRKEIGDEVDFLLVDKETQDKIYDFKIKIMIK